MSDSYNALIVCSASEDDVVESSSYTRDFTGAEAFREIFDEGVLPRYVKVTITPATAGEDGNDSNFPYKDLPSTALIGCPVKYADLRTLRGCKIVKASDKSTIDDEVLMSSSWLVEMKENEALRIMSVNFDPNSPHFGLGMSNLVTTYVLRSLAGKDLEIEDVEDAVAFIGKVHKRWLEIKQYAGDNTMGNGVKQVVAAKLSPENFEAYRRQLGSRKGLMGGREGRGGEMSQDIGKQHEWF